MYVLYLCKASWKNHKKVNWDSTKSFSRRRFCTKWKQRKFVKIDKMTKYRPTSAETEHGKQILFTKFEGSSNNKPENCSNFRKTDYCMKLKYCRFWNCDIGLSKTQEEILQYMNKPNEFKYRTEKTRQIVIRSALLWSLFLEPFLTARQIDFVAAKTKTFCFFPLTRPFFKKWIVFHIVVRKTVTIIFGGKKHNK